MQLFLIDSQIFWSPSSRRAWIEIRLFYWENYDYCVALLAEGVDRNRYNMRR